MVYQYSEPGPHGEDITTTITDQQILSKYFNAWLVLMSKSGKLEERIKSRVGLDILKILQTDCITDFITIHWAHAIEQEDK